MRSPLLPAAILVASASFGLAQAPVGYYASVDTSSPDAMRTTLHALIDDHQRIPYTSSSTDTWNVLEQAQQDPGNSGRILDVYRNESYPKHGQGNSDYEREHTWPKSYGFPDLDSDNYPYTDCHMLWLCNISYNQSRSNKPFRFCNPGCGELVTVFNNNQGGGSGSYPGNSNWTAGNQTNGTWETWIGRRGDVARSLLYADVRYEGGFHGQTGSAEPDLILTNLQSLITGSITGSNESVAYMGMLADLLAWHAEDPVDDFERTRNDRVFAWQHNRNPFVDHPEWVDCLFNSNCGFVTQYCTPSVANSTGASAEIAATGSNSVTLNNLQVSAFSMPANKFGYFLTSQTQGFVAGPGGSDGNLCLGGQIARFTAQVQNTGPFGTFAIPVDLTAIPSAPTTQVMAGETWNFTAWFRDDNPTPTSNFTDALSIMFF